MLAILGNNCAAVLSFSFHFEFLPWTEPRTSKSPRSPPHESCLDSVTVRWLNYFSNLSKFIPFFPHFSLWEALKTVLFGTNDPNVGGWGRVVPNFFDYYIRLKVDFFVPNPKFQISQNLWGEWVGPPLFFTAFLSYPMGNWPSSPVTLCHEIPPFAGASHNCANSYADFFLFSSFLFILLYLHDP